MLKGESHFLRTFRRIKNICSISDIEFLKSQICFISIYLMRESKKRARYTHTNPPPKNIIYMLVCLPSEMQQEEYKIPKLGSRL